MTLLRLERRDGVWKGPNNVIVFMKSGFGDEGRRDGKTILLTEEKLHLFLFDLLGDRRVLPNQINKIEKWYQLFPVRKECIQ